MSLNHNYKVLILPVFLAVFISLAAFFNFVNAQLAQGVTQDQIDAALDDLSQVYGQEVSTQEQAKEICNLDKYATDCAEIGKEHDLFSPERIEQVDIILDEIKGQVAEQIKSCQNIECLVGLAEGLATRFARRDPVLASEIGLTPTIVREKKEIVEIAKSAGVTIDQCIDMDPDTASVDLLRACARLAKESKIQKYIPIEVRTQVDQIADSTERTIQLKQALSGGQYQCGDNTIESCGNFCLNPGAEARASGGSAIPAVCKDIAAKFFGSQGVKELEKAYNRVSGVADYYYKKAQNSVFTTLDGQTLTNPEEIGAYMEAEGRAGNVEAVSKGMDFMIAQGFVTPADKDFAVKMVSKFRERGGVNFDVCVQNPASCKDFIHDDFQNDFDVMEQVFEIMRQELGFSPELCDQGQFDQSIGTKCLEGAKRALPKIEALASQYPEVMFMVEEIRGHILRGDQLTQKRDQFIGGNFAGPGGCRDERSCFVYCSNPANGPECIAFGSKQGISGFTGEQAIQKYQRYEYSLNKPKIEEEYITKGLPPYGDFIYPPGYQPQVFGGPSDQPPYSPQYGQPYGPRPGYPSYQPREESQFGPSPECVRAITSGDFVRAKEVCNVNIGGPQPVLGSPLLPTNPPICPASPYIECPAGQYHESFRNSDGCFVDGPCKPIPTYSPGPYPTYSPGPYTSPGGKPQCSDGIDNDNDGKIDYPADTSCYGLDDFDEYYPPEGGPYPTYSPGPGSTSCSKSLINLLGDGCHQMYSDSSGRLIYCDGPMSKSAKDGDTATTPGCYGSGGPQPSYSPYPTPGTGACPAGYHYHGEQGGFCINDQENYGGICYSADGKTKISCPSQSTGQCTPPQWWDPAKGYCVGSTSPSPWPSPGTSSCPAGYHYHGESGGFCMNDREDYSGTCFTIDGKSTTTCPKPTYTPGPSYTPAPSCPSGQWWDYARNACVSSTTTYTPYPTAGGCPPGSHSMGGYCMSDADLTKCGPLNSASTSSFGSCSSYQTTVTYTPAPSCPSGQWWDYANNYCRTDCASGTFWDPAQKKCISSVGGTYTPVPGTTYTYTPAPSCPSGQWWDTVTNSCKSISTTSSPYPTYTPYAGYCGDAVCSSSETSSSCPSDCGGGTATTYTPYPTTAYTPYPSCPSGQWWDTATNSCHSSTTTTTYTPYPTTTTSPPPSCPAGQFWDSATSSCKTASLFNHQMALHCSQLDREWNGQYCQPTGFLARVFENTLANLGKLIGF